MHSVQASITLAVTSLALVIFSKLLAQNAMSFQNKHFGRHYGSKEVRGSTWLYRLGGVLFFVLGVLTLVGKVHWK